MKLYNTLTKKKEEITPTKKGVISIYNCGPTVYNFPTIGNLRTYVNVDILRRALKLEEMKVNEVMNITDIEDKIIRDANKLGVKYTEITEKYTRAFLDNLEELNIEKPEQMPKATEEIPEMIKIIENLLESGHAYKSEDGSVYFSINKFKNYGHLSGLDKREIEIGARVAQDEYEKDNAQDFALWKAKKEGEPSWEAPFGEGRPGWHIECTAMSTKYLGNTIDIHSGGVDLIFPHHENEIAQSEAYTGQKFVNHWFHSEHLLINGERMGKSLGNGYLLNDLSDKFKVEPLAFRMICLSSHYRDKLNFTDKSIQDAQNSLNHLRDFVLRLKMIDTAGEPSKKVTNLTSDSLKKFKEALFDDLATPRAMAVVFDLIKSINKISDINEAEANLIYQNLEIFDKVLGLRLSKIKIMKIPAEIQKMAVEREDARKAGDYNKADEIRSKIEKANYIIEDTEDGPLLIKK